MSAKCHKRTYPVLRTAADLIFQIGIGLFIATREQREVFQQLVAFNPVSFDSVLFQQPGRRSSNSPVKAPLNLITRNMRVALNFCDVDKGFSERLALRAA